VVACRNKSNGTVSATVGLEAKSWLAVDKLRNNMDPAEHKYVAPSLVFPRYLTDPFGEHPARPAVG